jgi:choline kinase
MGLSYRNIVPIRGTKTHQYSIVIPAAGIGQRTRTHGVKSLIQITPDVNIITNQLEIIRRTFVNSEIIMVAGFEAEKLMDSTPNNIVKIHNEGYRDTNVSRSIGLGLRAATSDRVLIVYGDLVFNNEALQIPLKESCIVASENIMSSNEVGCVVDNNGYVENLMYDLPTKWAQITFLTGKELKLTQQLTWNRENDNLYGFEILNKVIDNGGRLLSISPHNIIANDIDSFKDLKSIRGIL